MELCGREDLSFGLYLNLVKKLRSVDVKTFFFWSLPIFSGKLTQGVILSHIFQKGAMVQKRLKTPGLD